MARGRQSTHGTLGRLATELAKFGAVGTVAFFVDLAVYNALAFTIMDDNPIGAKVFAVLVSTIVSWLGSRYWTFKDGAAKSAPAELFWFVLINAGGFVIAALCLVVSHYMMGLTSKLADNVSANFVGLALGNVFRYFMYKFLLYKIPTRRIASSTAGRSDAESGKR
ncbi:GtrA family protein [Spelaeicoccus albus]|uniref:Putative flippase GtrA n=2 Tax=Spelaeicoccus albus TaxID=1280376 RepID=A0A7Z0A7I0_9MICO|nr:GtrA family protein [Spelaeicoccus albus]NYI65869.1 putative flippase GtrA [Spelaeicoccus albus]